MPIAGARARALCDDEAAQLLHEDVEGDVVGEDDGPDGLAVIVPDTLSEGDNSTGHVVLPHSAPSGGEVVNLPVFGQDYRKLVAAESGQIVPGPCAGQPGDDITAAQTIPDSCQTW